MYSVSDAYINYLRKHVEKVYINKYSSHTRKYIGVVLQIKGFDYYIPLSSPKENDYQIAGDKKVIKKSITPIVRITEKKGEKKELKGTLRISNMIPVPKSELELYKVEDEEDKKYKEVIDSELVFIRKNAKMIRSRALTMYNLKVYNNESLEYVKMALDYKQLEQLCLDYNKN